MDAVTVVPNLNTNDVQQEGHHNIDAEQSRTHVYFKDLKLLADDEESEDDFGYSDSDLGSCISSPSESNKNVRNFIADFILKYNSMTIYYVCSKHYRGIKLKSRRLTGRNWSLFWWGFLHVGRHSCATN